MTKLLATLLYAAVFSGRSSVHAYSSILEQDEAGVEPNNLKGTTLFMNSGNAKNSNSFEKYISIYNRCCEPEFVLGGSRGECKCPVRTKKWWIFDWYSRWEAKCESSIAEKSSIMARLESNDDYSMILGLVNEFPALAKDLREPGDYTVFAPNNAAIELVEGLLDAYRAQNLLEEVIRTHVLGSVVKEADFESREYDTLATDEPVTVYFDGEHAKVGAFQNMCGSCDPPPAKITETDLQASNGVLHVIDFILVPDPYNGVSIMERLKLNPDVYSKFVAVLNYFPHLVEKLSKPGDYTVFAPTNDAIEKVEYLFGSLIQVEEIVKTHILDKVLKEADFPSVNKIKMPDSVSALDTLNPDVQVAIAMWYKGPSSVMVVGKALMGIGAVIDKTDIQGTNGVVHVITKVLTTCE